MGRLNNTRCSANSELIVAPAGEIAVRSAKAERFLITVSAVVRLRHLLALMLVALYLSLQASSAMAQNLSGVTSVAAGGGHTCAIENGGTVRCWGSNRNGQLGLGNTTDFASPQRVIGLTGITQIVAGDNHSCAMDGAGTVKCWGSNIAGQLGLGNFIDATAPQTVTLDTFKASQIVAGSNHTCAIVSTGLVQCWGSNTSGQLGRVSTAPNSIPLTIASASGLVGVIQLAAGSGFTCALEAGGALKCWGSNVSGQLGLANNTSSNVPGLPVTGLSGAIRIVAGNNFVCALETAGTVKCRGNSGAGQLGLGNNIRTNAPTLAVLNLNNVTQLVAGESHVCAISGGALKCWGSNADGQLGLGNSISFSSPQQISAGLNAVAGVAAGASHTCATETGGGLKCWGANNRGQLGTNYFGTSTTPLTISSGLAAVKQFATGFRHTCALETNGSVKCWGSNRFDELGLLGGTNASRSAPSLAVGNLTSVTQLVAGNAHTCALESSGGVKCWGDNTFGILGLGAVTSSGLLFRPVVGLAAVTQLVAGGDHTCALEGGGDVKCWGSNFYGQLGAGNNVNTSAPTLPVLGLQGVFRLAAGPASTCAIESGGAVKCWGYNIDGQLGVGTNSNTNAPTSPIAGLSNVIQVGVGSNHACALENGGTVKCWGFSLSLGLGNGVSSTSKPTSPVVGLSDALQLAVGGSQTCVSNALGGVQCWGHSETNVRDAGTSNFFTSPQAVIGSGATITDLAAGNRHMCALELTGKLKCWGRNYDGQLGLGYFSFESTPKSVVCPTCAVVLPQLWPIEIVAPTATNSAPVNRYRISIPSTGGHLFTTDENEYRVLTTLAPSIYIAEGVDHKLYKAAVVQNGQTAIPLFRLYLKAGRRHFWTSDRNEYVTLRQAQDAVGDERIDGYLFPSPGVAGTIPLYRIVLNGTSLHHWTSDKNEFDFLRVNGWIPEGTLGNPLGVIGYVVPR